MPFSYSPTTSAPPPRRNRLSSLNLVRGVYDRNLGLVEQKTSDVFEYNSPKLHNLRKKHHYQGYSVPPQCKKDSGKLTLVLDVDETLIHSKISPNKKAAQDRFRAVHPNHRRNVKQNRGCEVFEMVLCDGEVVVVNKRPGLDEFLSHVGERYEVMAYTAGLQQYAEPLLNWLDPNRTIFKHRLYRDSCLFTNGFYVKDLNKVNRCLRRTVLVDNNLCCFLPQLSNGIPISSFYEDAQDDALVVLQNYLSGLEKEKDVRPKLVESFNLVKALSQQRDLVLG